MKLASFDCYGTLIDWEGGMVAAMGGWVPPLFTERYIEIEAEVESEYRPYREVLEAALERALREFGLPGDARSFAQTIERWPPFPEVRAELEAMRARGWTLAILSNVDDDIIASSIALLGVRFDHVVTAQQVRSYKPARGHWLRLAEITGERTWLHVGASLHHDMEPAGALGLRRVWINRTVRRATMPLDGELTSLTGLAELAG